MRIWTPVFQNGIRTRIVGLEALRARVRGLSKLRPVTEALRRRLSDAWQSGGEQFVRATVKQMLVETGMSAASLYPLARALSKPRAEAAIARHIAQNATSGPIKGMPTLPFGRRIAGYQDIESGERLGERAYTFRVPAPGSRQIVFKFAFRISVFQHAYWEPQQQSLDEGIIAFEETVRRRFTQEARFIIRQYLRTGRSYGGPLGAVNV